MKKILTIALSTFVVGGLAALTIPKQAHAKPMGEVLPLPATLYDASGKEISIEQLRGKIVALYFSAEWCIPCKKFTPKLAKFREENAKKGFEVVFMSLDRSDQQKARYMKNAKMKWLTSPGQNTKEINQILDYYKLPGIPSLVVFGPKGQLITTAGRDDVDKMPETALAKWRAMIATDS